MEEGHHASARTVHSHEGEVGPSSPTKHQPMSTGKRNVGACKRWMDAITQHHTTVPQRPKCHGHVSGPYLSPSRQCRICAGSQPAKEPTSAIPSERRSHGNKTRTTDRPQRSNLLLLRMKRSH